MMLKIIIFFVALALIIYYFDSSIFPVPIDRDSTALWLAGQIAIFRGPPFGQVVHSPGAQVGGNPIHENCRSCLPTVYSN
jgi:hypothetical protein